MPELNIKDLIKNVNLSDLEKRILSDKDIDSDLEILDWEKKKALKRKEIDSHYLNANEMKYLK